MAQHRASINTCTCKTNTFVDLPRGAAAKQRPLQAAFRRNVRVHSEGATPGGVYIPPSTMPPALAQKRSVFYRIALEAHEIEVRFPGYNASSTRLKPVRTCCVGCERPRGRSHESTDARHALLSSHVEGVVAAPDGVPPPLRRCTSNPHSSGDDCREALLTAPALS